MRYERDLSAPWPPANRTSRNQKPFELGNSQPGDGKRFMGRGLIQITGRANYRACGAALGFDLEATPAMLKGYALAARSACWFWASRNLNRFADAGDFVGLTRAINGGINCIAERRAFWVRARAVVEVVLACYRRFCRTRPAMSFPSGARAAALPTRFSMATGQAHVGAATATSSARPSRRRCWSELVMMSRATAAAGGGATSTPSRMAHALLCIGQDRGLFWNRPLVLLKPSDAHHEASDPPLSFRITASRHAVLPGDCGLATGAGTSLRALAAYGGKAVNQINGEPVESRICRKITTCHNLRVGEPPCITKVAAP